MKIDTILDDLAATDSRLEKEAILHKHRHNENLRECVKLALSPLIQFYIRKIPPHVKCTDGFETITLKQAIINLSMLYQRVITGNAAIDFLRNILENVNETDSLVIERIIKKDLKCGVSTATANKIWPNLVPEFPCMLATGFDQKLVDKIKWPAIVQLKLDGMRCTVIVKNGAVGCYSRNGKPINLHGVFDSFFTQLVKKDSVVFDGELLVVDENENIVNRQTGNGILNKAIKGTIKKEEVENVRLVLFDVIPYDDFEQGVCNVPYKERFDALKLYLRQLNTKKIKLVDSWTASTQEEVNSIYQKIISSGQEGIILKCPKGIWENKRVKHQIKYKAELDCDLLCTGWEEGTGKYKGKMGALILESADGKLKVNVGTGFSDEQRVLLKNNTVGKIVAVCYNSIIEDKTTGTKSLFLPRFIEVREDKTVADSTKKIK